MFLARHLLNSPHYDSLMTMAIMRRLRKPGGRLLERVGVDLLRPGRGAGREEDLMTFFFFGPLLPQQNPMNGRERNKLNGETPLDHRKPSKKNELG